MLSNPAPVGECTCTRPAESACDYCQEMQLWAHVGLYGHEDISGPEERPCDECGVLHQSLDDLCYYCQGGVDDDDA